MENSFSKCPTPVQRQDDADSLLRLDFLFIIKHKIGCKTIKGYQLQVNLEKAKVSVHSRKVPELELILIIYTIRNDKAFWPIPSSREITIITIEYF
jgi:hypothetical protein